MKKTSIYLDPQVDRALERRAQAEGRPKAAVIRDALADAATAATAKPQGCGVFDGPPNLARDADAHLARTGFGRQ